MKKWKMLKMAKKKDKKKKRRNFVGEERKWLFEDRNHILGTRVRTWDEEKKNKWYERKWGRIQGVYEKGSGNVWESERKRKRGYTQPSDKIL